MRILFTCGGTGGHIYPAVSIAEEITKIIPDAEYLFIGADGMMEMDIVPKCGYPIKAVPVTNLSRGKKPKDIVHNIKTVFNVLSSLFKSRRLIKQFRPDAVIGTGGYVCFPVIFAAWLLGIPAFVHESNSEPGLTTRMLSHFVKKVFTGYRESIRYYKDGKAEYTGTPVRVQFDDSADPADAFDRLGTSADLPLIVSVWGSLGSGFMNEVFSKIVRIMPEKKYIMLHVTGKRYYDQYKHISESDLRVIRERYFILKDFVYDLPLYLHAAGLVICRAGASTLAELAYLGKPAIIVPSPNVVNNHQDKNARVFEAKGAAVVLREGTFSPEVLLDTIGSILSSPEKMEAMSSAMHSFCVPDSARIIADKVLEHVTV
ncbi:MAG: undecaprenyldiphospho-muramoylpentapeptide beta-N-acetylglucosaminyltransferase [Oscillospiraceae bacterium]|nr:undecaprenyldiphospho-muramoylpentapeptide beta-N-acetylglucosaminyltransferase [Oscillospiraceae bacterium]